MPIKEQQMREGSPPAYPSRLDNFQKINEIIKYVNDLERNYKILENNYNILEERINELEERVNIIESYQ